MSAKVVGIYLTSHQIRIDMKSFYSDPMNMPILLGI